MRAMPNAELLTVPSVLRSHYITKAARNPAYSLRAFARDISISHSFLSRILGEKKRLSLAQASRVAERLKLAGQDRQRFIDAAAQQLCKPTKNRVNESQNVEESLQLDVDRFKSISEWHHSAILEVLAQKTAKHSAKSLADRLNLSEDTIADAVSRLCNLGLIVRRDGQYHRTSKVLVVPTRAAESCIRSFHEHMIGRALAEIQDTRAQSFHARDVAGITVLADPERIQKAKDRVRKFRRELMGFLSKGRPSIVYQFNTQLFSLERERPT